MKSFLPALLTLTFLFLLNFLSRIIFSPLLPVIKEEMGLTNAGSGSLFLLISSGYFISILSSSYVSSYINHKNSIFLSTFYSGAIVVCLAFLQSPVIFKWGLFVLGLAAGLYLPSALASIAHTVAPAYLARGMAVHELAPNVGFVLAPFLCEMLLVWFTWRSIIMGLGVCMMVMSLIYYFSKSGCLRRGRPLSYQIAKEILFNTKFLVLVALFSLA
ncbi:MAG: multidrug efflux MFS transporter, partial [Bacteroidetes bacterium]|nr:multidrug efflux MFS transporter [Bacteroidota bacterium]